MNNSDLDRQIWKDMEYLYKENCSGDELEKNLLEAYWCRPDGEKQDLFRDRPDQRIFARFLRSYLNTTWHKIQKDIKPFIESWFNSHDTDIIRNVEKDRSALPEKLRDFCEKSLGIVSQLQLKKL